MLKFPSKHVWNFSSKKTSNLIKSNKFAIYKIQKEISCTQI